MEPNKQPTPWVDLAAHLSFNARSDRADKMSAFAPTDQIPDVVDDDIPAQPGTASSKPLTTSFQQVKGQHQSTICQHPDQFPPSQRPSPSPYPHSPLNLASFPSLGPEPPGRQSSQLHYPPSPFNLVSFPSLSQTPQGSAMSPPNVPPSPQYIGPRIPPVSTVPISNWKTAVSCFTSPNHNPANTAELRARIEDLYTKTSISLHTHTLKTPTSEIPTGSWTIAFAPSILSSGGWVITFAAPMASEMVWFFRPAKTGLEEEVMQILDEMVKEGKLKKEESMEVGGGRHKMFHAMIAQALFVAQAGMDFDWRSAEFASVIDESGVDKDIQLT
ncbi:hypothetical protein BCR34DRAFT_584403 [Clohesyomyces aquaticus]|uniref:Uncharacterized protein n=1 Tax=Clohesyomyces aquaticus TaxID=1231657 RepID=A0A1Y2A1Y7_9PLEO|nr:hypothetical protein BCR34DRAFT_584403 [Clohesyomyces aquaticus]